MEGYIIKNKIIGITIFISGIHTVMTTKKSFLLLLLLVFCLAFIPLTTLAAESSVQIPAITIQLDGKTLTTDVAPFIDRNKRTMMPVRLISEALGAQVEWDGDNRVVTVTKESTVIKLTIDSPQIVTNGNTVEMDTAAIIKDHHTFVPIRYIAEALGLSVGWDDAASTVVLNTAGTPKPPGTDQIYLGITQAETKKFLGEPDSIDPGSTFQVLYRYTDFASLYFSGSTLHDRNPSIATIIWFNSGKAWDMYDLVSTAVKQHNMKNAAEGEYPVETHFEMEIKADPNSFTVYTFSLFESYLPDGEYNVRRVRNLYTPLELTFAKNTSGEYELAVYREPEDGEKWEWTEKEISTYGEPDNGKIWRMAENNLIDENKLGQTTYMEAMLHFVGAVPWDSAYGAVGHTIFLTNVALTNDTEGNLTENGYGYTIKYLPGAKLQILEQDENTALHRYSHCIIEYADPSKNITIGKSGTGEIPITDDLIGILCTDFNLYAMKFEKYIPKSLLNTDN